MVSQHFRHGGPNKTQSGSEHFQAPSGMLADGVQPNLSIEVHAKALYSRIPGDQPRAAMARDADFNLSCKELKP